jgi:hypothetical protein
MRQSNNKIFKCANPVILSWEVIYKVCFSLYFPVEEIPPLFSIEYK